MTARPARVDAHEAVAALRDGLAACIMCRPDLELGDWRPSALV
ncbi:DUF6233 domain-containing protein, partial [Streptomyces sp. NPDC001156]